MDDTFHKSLIPRRLRVATRFPPFGDDFFDSNEAVFAAEGENRRRGLKQPKSAEPVGSDKQHPANLRRDTSHRMTLHPMGLLLQLFSGKIPTGYLETFVR